MWKAIRTFFAYLTNGTYDDFCEWYRALPLNKKNGYFGDVPKSRFSFALEHARTAYRRRKRSEK